jgi:hypothetical protein
LTNLVYDRGLLAFRAPRPGATGSEGPKKRNEVIDLRVRPLAVSRVLHLAENVLEPPGAAVVEQGSAGSDPPERGRVEAALAALVDEADVVART